MFRIQWISAPVDVAGNVQTYAVMVREHNEGWLQYDLTNAVFPGARSETGGDRHEALFDPAKEGAPGKASIAADGAGINLHLIDPQGRARPWDGGSAGAPDAAALARLQTALAGRLRALGLDGRIALRVVDGIRAAATGEKLSGVDGSYYQRLIQVAYQAPDAAWTLNHEVIHALRDMGLFKPAEWTALQKAALADTARMAEIRERYRGQGLSEAELIEEAIGDMFADWHRQAQAQRGFIRDAFERVRDVLRAIHAAFTGAGFPTADSVFRSVDRGDVGRRGEGSRWSAARGQAAIRREPGLDGSPGARRNRAIGQGFLTRALWEKMRVGLARPGGMGSGSEADRVQPGRLDRKTKDSQNSRGVDGTGLGIADGEALATFYHGTRDDIEAFDPKSSQPQGSWVAGNWRLSDRKSRAR